MQSIDNYVPETHHVSTVHSIAAIPLVTIYDTSSFISHVEMYCTFTSAVFKECVQ
jgi:hypothetical protein